MISVSGHWYTLQTKLHKERQVAESLRQRNMEVYLPLVRVNPVNPRAAHVRPFFPGYLFLNSNLEEINISSLQWTPGVKGFVKLGGELALVPDHVVSELKQRLDKIRTAGGEVFYGLHSGDRIRITDGPFAGYEALFDLRLSGTERVRVLLKLIHQTNHRRLGSQRFLPIELNAGSLERVK